MESQEYDNISSKVENQFNTKKYLKTMDMIRFMVNLVLDYMELYLTIEPLNKTMTDSDAALIFIENIYNDLTESEYISSIQNITKVTYGGQQSYKTILDAGGGAVYGYATIQHRNVLFVFYMFNNDRANYQGTLFNQIVNSTKLFD